MKEKKGSQRQLEFYRRKKQYRKEIRILRVLLLIGFLVLWEAAADFRWVDPFIFSSPCRVWKTFFSMCREQSLLSHIWITFYETVISFFLVMGISLATAVILWAFPPVSDVLEPYLVVLNSLPKSALAPLLIVWMGANSRTIITAGISVAVFGSIINLYTAFCSVDPEMRKLIVTLGGTKKEELFLVLLPHSLPAILSTWKVNIGLCLVGVVIGEFIGARKGLGYLIIYGTQVFRLDWVILSILLLCVLAVGFYWLIGEVEHLVSRRK